MSKKSGSFADMKQTLSDYIKQNEDLRTFLLAQEGGIMKYWAEHPDSDFDVDLFDSYEKQIVKSYLQANKRDRGLRSLSNNELKDKSFDWYHLSKGSEFKFFVAMKPLLNALDVELPEQAFNYIEIYMVDAYKEKRRRKYPEGIPPQDFYYEVLEKYGHFGLALYCLERVLQEYRGNTIEITARNYFLTNIVNKGESPEWKEVDRLQMEFDIKMFRQTFFVDGGYKKLRQAVKEMIDNSTKGMTEEECREECRKIAIDNMEHFNQFTRWVNNESYPMEESESGELVPLMTPEERHWLRNIMYKNSPGGKGTEKLTPMRENFGYFLIYLDHIGTIWAAQLLAHGIDMKELEKKTGIVLSKLPGTMYYVDRTYDDRPGDCCIFDGAEAKKLLQEVRRKTPPSAKEITWEEEKQCFKTAVLYVMNLKRRNGNYLFEKNTHWIAVYRFAVDSGVMYDMGDKSEPQDKSQPQYTFFEKFARELQLDNDNFVRIPFMISSIDGLSKENYKRYRHKHPWSSEGLKERSKSLTLYKELDSIYRALRKSFNDISNQASIKTD